MFKKIAFKTICIFLLFCILLTGCNKAEEEQKSMTSSNKTHSDTETTQTLATASILERSSRKSYKRLIKKSYHQKELISNLSYFGADNFNTMLDEINEKYPVECIRTFDDSLTYCIYKLKEGGLLYVFFHSDILKFADYVFVVKDTLYKKDFDKLRSGDSISEVESIDKGTKLINSIYTEYLNNKTTFHMVKDGFMKIEYTSQSRDISTYKVKSVEFVPNGGKLTQYSYYLLPEDY
ncbi:MAG: hypothetical protein RR497_00580 [Oscillospiraceae bacterium]